MKLKRVFKTIVILVMIIILLAPMSYGFNLNLNIKERIEKRKEEKEREEEKISFSEQIEAEEGSMFDKIIAQCIGGIAGTVLTIATGDTFGVGFKNYDRLIFNRGIVNNSMEPFTSGMWASVLGWYRVFAAISGVLILIATFILAYKIIYAGVNTMKNNEAKESLMRLLFGGCAIALGPFFVRFLLFINNSLVGVLVNSDMSTLNGKLGEGMMTSIKTGNALTTAIVISMFVYLYIKINIKFIIREFTIIIFTIFTPVACGLWIINKNVTAASIWAGQIFMNIFMQFVYCFLFLIYLEFLPSTDSWATSLIWAMMIMPLADTLLNCLQNLTSRIAGLDNEQMTGRVFGAAGMLGYGMSAIKEQFASRNNYKSDNEQSSNSTGGGLNSFIGRVKNVVNPQMNLSDSVDYNGNYNPIRDNISRTTRLENTDVKRIENSNSEQMSRGTVSKVGAFTKGVVKTGYKVGKAYYKVGETMVEGNFNKPQRNNKKNTSNIQQTKQNIQNLEYMNQIKKPIEEKGDKDEKETKT